MVSAGIAGRRGEGYQALSLLFHVYSLPPAIYPAPAAMSVSAVSPVPVVLLLRVPLLLLQILLLTLLLILQSLLLQVGGGGAAAQAGPQLPGSLLPGPFRARWVLYAHHGLWAGCVGCLVDWRFVPRCGLVPRAHLVCACARLIIHYAACFAPPLMAVVWQALWAAGSSPRHWGCTWRKAPTRSAS